MEGKFSDITNIMTEIKYLKKQFKSAQREITNHALWEYKVPVYNRMVELWNVIRNKVSYLRSDEVLSKLNCFWLNAVLFYVLLTLIWLYRKNKVIIKYKIKMDYENR